MDEGRRRALVTGTSTGIGEACVVRLLEGGWTVYAGVRREADARRWRETEACSSGRLVPLFCDVCLPDQLEATLARLEADGGRLDALINNAGISIDGPLEYLDPAELRRILEVNVVGPHALTRACLPYLRRSTGRVVMVGSVSGRTAMPLVGPYCASKHALEALCDSLRVELRPWGLKVVMIQPGPIRTPIWDKVAAERSRLGERYGEEALERYGDLMEVVFNRVMKTLEKSSGPDAVARVIERALLARNPRPRYVVGRGARFTLTVGRLPDRLRDWLVARAIGHQPPKGK